MDCDEVGTTAVAVCCSELKRLRCILSGQASRQTILQQRHKARHKANTGVCSDGNIRICQGNTPPHPWDTHYQWSNKNLYSQSHYTVAPTLMCNKRVLYAAYRVLQWRVGVDIVQPHHYDTMAACCPQSATTGWSWVPYSVFDEPCHRCAMPQHTEHRTSSTE